MTVEELINELEEVVDKSTQVYVYKDNLLKGIEQIDQNTIVLFKDYPPPVN